MITVAVYGVNGSLGKHVVSALLRRPFESKIQRPIRLVTSTGRTTIESSEVEYFHHPDVSFVDAFRDVDVVINLGHVPFSPIEEILDAVVANGVKLYIPSQFGADFGPDQAVPGFFEIKHNHSKRAREKGIQTVDIHVGLHIDEDQLFRGCLLPYIQNQTDENTVDVIGDESTRINPTFVNDIGSTVAALVTQNRFENIPNEIRVYSSKVTVGDTIDHYERVKKTKLKRNYVSREDVLRESNKRLENGFKFEFFMYYLRALIAKGEGGGIIYETNHDREFVNPGEQYFKWTRYEI